MSELSQFSFLCFIFIWLFESLKMISLHLYNFYKNYNLWFKIIKHTFLCKKKKGDTEATPMSFLQRRKKGKERGMKEKKGGKRRRIPHREKKDRKG